MTQCRSIHDSVDTMKVSNVLPHDTILFDKWLDRNDTNLVIHDSVDTMKVSNILAQEKNQRVLLF